MRKAQDSCVQSAPGRATRPVSALESIQIEVDMNLGAMAGGERDHEHPGCAGAIYFQPSTCHG